MRTSPHIDFPSITALLGEARAEGRDFLYEYEVYALLARSGAETPPGPASWRAGPGLRTGN
jgi:hypothetical protein